MKLSRNSHSPSLSVSLSLSPSSSLLRQYLSANYAGTLFVLLIIPSYPFPFSPLAVSSHPRTSVPLFLRFFRFHSPYHPVVSAAFFSHRRSLIRLTGADERDSPSIRSDLVTFARHHPLISSVIRKLD